MSHVTLDSSAASQLNQVTESVEVRDPSGRVIGRFVPLIDKSEWEPLSSEISEEELDRRERSNEKTYTTAEVLAYLEKQ
jgi:hypothetical protein